LCVTSDAGTGRRCPFLEGLFHIVLRGDQEVQKLLSAGSMGRSAGGRTGVAA
jgi:hypothetical protein